MNHKNDARDLLAKVLSSQGTSCVGQIGVLDLFNIGIGPSSSHTVGPMKAARAFISRLSPAVLAATSRIAVTLFGSLAWTGAGHGTEKAIILGLGGHRPEQIDPDSVVSIVSEVTLSRRLVLPDGRNIEFDQGRDIHFDRTTIKRRHPNAMSFRAVGMDHAVLAEQVWYSVGGGFIETDETLHSSDRPSDDCRIAIHSAAELLRLCRGHTCTIADLALASECSRRSESEILRHLDRITDVMMACIDRGLVQEGLLPGPLNVQRRARSLYEKAKQAQQRNPATRGDLFNYISAFAIAVNEENAAGGRVVTAPTNGAAGVIPATLRYYREFCASADRDGERIFMLTAGLIGVLIKRNASISGAEVGCQGEVGSAAAMAAAGLAAALGGSNEQIENAAEIAMEHHLGMTCDPIAGLVQIPCIERNAFGAIKAVNAAHLALAGDGSHRVSLDQVIETMRRTGKDMHENYRETSRGGLALSVPEC